MTRFISARKACTLKDDFDYCMKNWKSMADETESAWSHLDKQLFREKLLATMKEIVEDKATPIPAKVPDSILVLLKDELFHPITMLDTINKANQIIQGNGERLLELMKLLAEYWMQSSYFTQILLSFTRAPNSSRKITNTKSYYGVVFTMGEKLVEQDKFIRFLFAKLDTALRVIVERDDARIIKLTYPSSIATLIERIFFRYCAGIYRTFERGTEDNPFVAFMDSLMNLCQRNLRIQRIMSSLVLQITASAQEKLLSCWFSSAADTGIESCVPFHPVSTFYKHIAYQTTLMRTLPFESVPNFSTVFWTNWARYLTSDSELIILVWDNFMESFWALATRIMDGERLKTPSYAFAALALAVKPRILELKQVFHVSSVLDKITRMMDSIDVTRMSIAMAVAHIIFDLDRVQQEVKSGKTISADSMLDCDDDIFLQLVGYYEGKSSEDLRLPASKEIVVTQEVESSADDDNGQEKLGLDERVIRLRAEGLTPTSMKDVYHILLGETTSTNDSETEALKQVAVLSIPILLSAGESVETAHVELIGRTLFEWGKDTELGDFLTVALFELGVAYPELISKTLCTIIFNNNHGVGEKCRMLNVTEKIFLYCGTNRCISCFTIYGAYNKDDMKMFITRMEPAYFSKYLHRNRDQALCITCPPTPDEVFDESEESIERRLYGESNTETPTSEIQSQDVSSSPALEGQETVTLSTPLPAVVQRGPPPTRRWGTKRKDNMQIVTSKKKTLHTTLWITFYQQLTVTSDLFLEKKSSIDSVKIQFLIQILEFLRILVITYTGLSYFVQNIPKEALNLVRIYGHHPHVKVRKVLWEIVLELIQNTNIFGELSIIENVNEPQFYADLFASHLDEENEHEIREIIIKIRKLYKYQKHQRIVNQ